METIDTTNLNSIIDNLQAEINVLAGKINQAIPQTFVGQILQFDYTGTLEPDEKRFDTVGKVNAFFGGQWEAFSPGRVLVGVGSNEGKTYTEGQQDGFTTHKLSEAEMPSHYHKITTRATGTAVSYTMYIISDKATNCYTTTEDHQGTTKPQGQSAAHNNMQPYRVVYMWRRTA